jgi:putative membrane protein
MPTLFAFLHHLAAFTLTAALGAEFVLLRLEFTRSVARSLRLADALFGVSAGLVLAIGVVRVLYLEKGAEFYLSNPAFIAKISLFIAVGLLSIIPTKTFLSWGRELPRSGPAAIPERQLSTLKAIVTVELAGVALILLCAAAMARGAWM